jgi:hypothetical protein
MVLRLFAAGILLLGGCATSSAGAISFNFTGNFTHDNDVQLFTVTLGVPEVLTAWTTSGATGGFPTYLAMFDGTGQGMTQQSGDPACFQGFSSYFNGQCNDAEISEPPSGTIAAGTYIIALTQWSNVMVGNLSDGFLWVDQANDPNFTAMNGCAGSGYFCDPGTLAYDNSNWAVTIQLSNPDLPAQGSASEGLGNVPEPSSGLLVLGGLSVAWWMRPRKRRA